jgi:serine/threonine-protein kinase RCK2
MLSNVRCSLLPTVSFSSSLTDLIRYGKHHQNRHSAPANTRDLPPQNTVAHTPAAAAARIVDEERKEKSTMPTFKGLEHFKLEDKMGECVFDHLSIISLFLTDFF